MLLKVTRQEESGGIGMTGSLRGLLIWKTVAVFMAFGLCFFLSLKDLPGQHGLVGWIPQWRGR